MVLSFLTPWNVEIMPVNITCKSCVLEGGKKSVDFEAWLKGRNIPSLYTFAAQVLRIASVDTWDKSIVHINYIFQFFVCFLFKKQDHIQLRH